MRTRLRALIAFACLATALPADAQSAGEWAGALGAHHVIPRSDNRCLVGGAPLAPIDGSTRSTIAFPRPSRSSTFMRARVGVEPLAAKPIRRDLDIANLGRSGRTKHLSPTLSL